MASVKANENEFLRQVLARNHLAEPNGQPLFQYQLSDGEYRNLEQLLRQYPDPPGKSQLDKVYCELFCLFCAEWFRRDYQGGWISQPLWQILGYEITPNDRGYVVLKGLSDYWGRPVSQYTDGSDKLICQSLFSWVNDGSHSIHDDLYINHGEQTNQVYLRVFRDIFKKANQLGHYNMMTGEQLMTAEAT